MIKVSKYEDGFYLHTDKQVVFGFSKERFGWELKLPIGFKLGFIWHSSQGESSKSSAVLFSWHHPKSITWRFSFTWSKPSKLISMPSFKFQRNPSGYNWYHLHLPIGGGFGLSTQPHMRRD